MATPPVLEKRSGLGYWMQEVLQQCERASPGLEADPVHDLRTSLRRCRSMADGTRVFDRDPAWKKMRRAGKQLFSSLGNLRDTHVMLEWVEKLSPAEDPAGKALADYLAAQEEQLKKAAAIALQDFDRKQWKAWTNKLPERAARIAIDSPVFAHIALERWQQARVLHHRALRNRTNVAFHQLRIGLKRFRYTVENFLPRLYEQWGEDLKRLQDLLGEVHDLDVLWQTAVNIGAFPDAAVRVHWRGRIQEERRTRLDAYRSSMTGSSSLWRAWRAVLPKTEELRAIGLERLKIWASFLDPDVAHSRHVARLALQVYDGLPTEGAPQTSKRDESRSILHLAALTHEVGRSRKDQGHHKASARLLRRLDPPLGWTASELLLASFVARYHRGALPRESQRRFGALSRARQRLVQFLGGILRLACACDWQHDRKIRRVVVESSDSVLRVRAAGYIALTPLAEHLAAARHLLELAYHRPMLVLSAEEKANANAA